jgi:chromosome segregation ATPase
MQFARKAVLGAFAAAVATAVEQTPIGRVVELLKEIEETSEAQGKAEEKAYYKFVCWGTTVIDTKTASNEVANKRIEELETYIEDISAGRIEFTTERVDLEKELGEINAAIESATALRKKENEEFLSAEEEMKQAVAAMEKAIIVLKEATASKEQGSFVQAKSDMTYSMRKAESESLARAAELGARVLTAGDALFLKRLLAGDVPKADWKKLNRKATFKSSYKARSGKIQDLLANLLKTISTNLSDAQAKEVETQKNFDNLMESKKAEKSTCEDALNNMEAENGARDATKQESQDEVDDLKEQVANDEKYIGQTEMQLKDMKVAYKDRYTLRAQESAAIAKAIEILNNDAARDNQKKAFASQGYMLLQVQSDLGAGRRMVLAASAAIRASDSTGRLAALAGLVALNTGSHFTEVLEAIDKMVVVLKEEEQSDLATKETCEKDRAEATREAALKSRGMDELTESNNKLSAQIEEIKAEIVEKNAAIAATEKSVADATTNRERENTDYKASERDDKLAKDTVKSAKDVLTSFYKDNGLMFLQQPAGEAPPPPPATFDAPYGGQTDTATSILAILDMIIDDVQKDMEKAKAEEEKAAADFEIFKTESEASIQSLTEEVTALEGVQGEKESKVTQNVESRATMHEELNAVMKLIADAKPGCDFFTINYPSRVKNRHIEIDGLGKAKTILSGGSFNAAPDPNREMNVGDAFLARRHIQ